MWKKVAFTMYPVSDWKRARAFYGDTLGLTMGSASENGVWTEYDLPGGGCLALFAGPDAKPGGGASVALEVESLDTLLPVLEARGVKIVHAMIHSPVCRMSVINETEGNTVLLHELKKK